MNQIDVLDFFQLNQIEAKEHEYPYKIHKVPVKSGFLDHLIMSALVEMTESGFDVHDDVDDHTGKHMETMETGNAEEIAAEGDGA